MGGQEGYPDASKHVYENTGILTPSSDTTLDVETSSRRGTRKRKRDGNTIADLLDDAFIVKPHPSTIFTKPRTLRPVALLSRSHLPLSCLDLSSLGTLPDSRLFESHVKILELEQRIGNTPVALIALLDDGKSFFAVERESGGLYVLCKLGSWVDLNRLCAAAIVSRHLLLENGKESIPKSTRQIQITAEASKYNKKKRLAIEAIQSMVKRPSGGILSRSEALSSSERHPSETQNHVLQEETTKQCPSQSSSLLDLSHQMEASFATQPQPRVTPDPTQQVSSDCRGDVVERPVTGQILQNIRSQYFEALYLSKASLAYFAKGPLSRARAAFHLDYDSTLDMNDLVQFLDDLILSTKLLDKKYKDGVPSVVASMIMEDGSPGEAEDATSNLKRRKSKKMKPDRKGLYPGEDTFLRRWWSIFGIDSESGDLAGSRGDIAKKRTMQLRIRETQLQMIVILETLALQPLAKTQTDHNNELPFTGLKGVPNDETATARGKLKKPRDLMALLDVHVDRLCIWQSVVAEGPTLGLVKESRDTLEPGSLTRARTGTSDVLREFCVGVILPFFSARLPEQCAAVSRKLSGHIISSPVRPRLSTATSSSTTAARPGAIVKRQVPPKPRRSLQRVLTDERYARGGSRGPSRAASLMRSTASPAVLGLKREGSESSSLGIIPPIEAQGINASRGGVLKSKKFSQREVDLSSLVSVNETKFRKVNIEAELKDAIATLKRPNRQLAVQDLVDTADRRASSITNHSHRSKKRIQNPLFQGVQIMATPKGRRKKDVTVETRAIPPLPLIGDLGQEVVAINNLHKVPQSICRVADGSKLGNVNRCQIISNTNFSTKFEDCTSRRDSELPHSSPLRARHSDKQSLPGTPRVIENFQTPTRAAVIHATPIKLSMEHCTDTSMKPIREVESTVETQKQEIKENQSPLSSRIDDDSIYKSLGWDDDDLT